MYGIQLAAISQKYIGMENPIILYGMHGYIVN